MNDNIKETLLHRLDTVFKLSEDFEKHRSLLPEIIIKTLRDADRYKHGGISHSSGAEIAERLNFDADEVHLISRIENSLRKSKDYNELCGDYSLDTLLSIVQKLHVYMIK